MSCKVYLLVGIQTYSEYTLKVNSEFVRFISIIVTVRCREEIKILLLLSDSVCQVNIISPICLFQCEPVHYNSQTGFT